VEDFNGKITIVKESLIDFNKLFVDKLDILKIGLFGLDLIQFDW